MLPLAFTVIFTMFVDTIATNAPLFLEANPFTSGRLLLGRELGRGTFSNVSEVWDTRRNRTFAAKVVIGTEIEQFEREVEILRAIEGHSDSIVQIYDAFAFNGMLCMTMDLLSGGELFDYVANEKRLTMSTAAKMLKTMTSAVDHLHENNIVHLDIKLENFVFRTKKRDPSDLVLIDLGFSRQLVSGEMLYCNWGSPEYMPAYRLDGACTAHDLKLSDNYALGVILWSMVFGSIIEPHDTMEFIDDEHLKDLLSCLISDDPTDILTTKQILDHPFLRNTKDAFALDRPFPDRRFLDPLPPLMATKIEDSTRIRSDRKPEPCMIM